MMVNNLGLLERVAAIAGEKIFDSAFPAFITGSQHSDSFVNGDIVAGVTVLSAFREHSYSNKEARAFRIRVNDKGAVVLCREDQDPNDTSLTDHQRANKHGGYIGHGTDARAAVVELMDDVEIGPHIKVMCVYTNTTNPCWLRKNGRGCSAYPGQVFIFVDSSEKEKLHRKIRTIIARYGLEE